MEISFNDLGEHKVIKVNGEVDLYNVSELKKALFNITNSECASIIIDMSNINYMDSSGIGALVAGQKKMRAKNGKFALMSIHEDVLNILKLATLDKFFKIYNSPDDVS
jgi:anti-anti-sigma factor